MNGFLVTIRIVCSKRECFPRNRLRCANFVSFDKFVQKYFFQCSHKCIPTEFKEIEINKIKYIKRTWLLLSSNRLDSRE